jgi:hypothetical protein
MTINEQLFKILDKMFPDTYDPPFGFSRMTVRDQFEYDEDGYRIRKTIDIRNLQDMFEIAEKIGLFFSYTLHKRGLEYVIINRVTEQFDAICGDTPQEAIVNAIIAIHGDIPGKV